MLRRLHPDQPDSFAFTPENQRWAEGQMTKFPEGRQASAIIPLLWRAQEQEGWLSRPAIEYVARMLGLEYIRALEVATFYFMFQLQPVGSVAHIQVCGTLSCMICGAEDLIAVCKEKIAAEPHALSADGKFSWEEVECLGSCANAPMAQIGKDYYEDLTATRMGEIIDELAAGGVPVPGPQNGRFAAEPLKGLTSLEEYDSGKTKYNASVQLATDIGDTVKRIDGTEVPILTPWVDGGAGVATKTKPAAKAKAATKAKAAPKAKATPKPKAEPKATAPAKPAAAAAGEKKPRTLSAPRKSGADNLKLISGVGPKLEGVLNELGFWHFDQIAKWTEAEVAWVDSRLKFKGRIERDNWMAQAAELAKK
ncbi:NADH-quinone oxidoreductase subunit E [Yoonia sp. R2331]|uniref:NADH-quinone oxidoreductase subunit E n=1 Tax=Yoonia sp. R2331 TaxID=3237238 RepID=UPI0034E425BA